MGKVTRGSVGAERARASGAPTDPSTTSRGRFSVQKKTAAVLRTLMRVESLDIASRDVGVTAGRLSEWRDQFHAGAQAALRARPSDDRDEKVKDDPGEGWRAHDGQRAPAAIRSNVWKRAAL